MEMYLFDRLAIGLERLYTAVPSTLLKLYEVTWEASSLSCILGQELYKCVLLIIDIIRAILRLLAYFFHFDPPTFDALRDMARIYLDPDAVSDQKERLVLEHIIVRLEADNVMLLAKNAEMSAHICFLEAHAQGVEASLSQQEDTARQLLLGILACRQTTRPLRRQQSPKPHLGVSAKRLDPRHITREDTDEIQTHYNITPPLLVELLMFRNSTRRTANAVTTVTSANRHLKVAVRCCEVISQSLLIELLTIRKDARALCAQNRIKSRLAIVLVRNRQQEMQAREAEHETTTKHILIQTLTLRSRLSHFILSCKSTSLNLAPPILPVTPLTPFVSFQSLTTQLEALRVSEAQARAEKDGLAKSLSDVLANLPLPYLCMSVIEEEPIRELVLALSFAWKMLRRKPTTIAKREEVQSHKVDMQTDLNLRGERLKRLRPCIPFDSVRARAYKLGPPMNQSAIPTQDAPRHHLYDAHASIDFDPYRDRCLTFVTNAQPQFPPGIPLPLHLARSPVVPPNHRHVSGPSYSNSIHPPRSTIMSRGGYSSELPNEVRLSTEGQAPHESAIGYWASSRPIGASAHGADVALSVVQHVPLHSFFAS